MSKVAVCFSMDCMNSVAQTGKGVVVEHARLDDIFCPRCGHAIFWARVRDGETYDDYYNRKNEAQRSGLRTSKVLSVIKSCRTPNHLLTCSVWLDDMRRRYGMNHYDVWLCNMHMKNRLTELISTGINTIN
jgi:hypothetical protein